MNIARFLGILLRSMVLNATMIVMLSCISMAACGEIFFFLSSCDNARFLTFMYIVVNVFHWIMEILLLFFKPRDYDPF